METKPLLYGLIGFFIGGLIVSIAATTLDKSATMPASDMSMSQMTGSLQGKQGDDFDQAFISAMIEHHQGAVDMAKLSASNAKHDDIKQLSLGVIAAQEKEIDQMKQWQIDWGYINNPQSHSMNGMAH